MVKAEKKEKKWADSLFVEIQVINSGLNAKLKYSSIIEPKNRFV